MPEAATLTEAAAGGDLRTTLEALRDRLALEIDLGARCVKCGGAMSSPTPALAKQLRDTLTQLAGMKRPKESRTDELKRDAAARRAAASVAPTTGGDV